MDVVAAPRQLLAELGRDRARAADGRVADDADPHSRITWWPRAKRSSRSRSTSDEREAVAGERRDEAEPALLQRAAGQQRVARAAQALRAALVALLERAQRLLVQRVDLVQRATAGRDGCAARSVGSCAAERLARRRASSRSIASRARAKAASTSG